MAEYAKHRSIGLIRIATAGEFHVVPSILKECEQLPNNINPRSSSQLAAGIFALPAGMVGDRIAGGFLERELEDAPHFRHCIHRHDFRVSGFAVRMGEPALVLRCMGCGRAVSICAHSEPALFVEAWDTLRGDADSLREEFRVLGTLISGRPLEVPELVIA